MAASLPFLVFGFVGTKGAGPNLLSIGLGLVGLAALSVGIYHGFWRIDYRDQRFIAHPGRREYRTEDLVSWKLHEDTDLQPGYRRHLELRFDRWYRRYILCEEDLPKEAFDALLTKLRSSADLKRTEH